MGNSPPDCNHSRRGVKISICREHETGNFQENGHRERNTSAHTLDKSTWKKILGHYRAWDEAELWARIRDAGKKTDEQRWQEFLSIIEFGMMIKPQPGRQEQCQKIEMLNRYYQRIRRFEEWRKRHGKSDLGVTA